LKYQISWQEKLKKLPEEIFKRLEKTANQSTPKRALLIGAGIILLLPDLNEFLNKSEWKLFISRAEDALPTGRQECTTCDHNLGAQSRNLTTPHDNLVYLKGEPTAHLTSLPAGIFDLVISLWDLPSQISDNIFYTNNLYRLLKKGGRFSIITYLDGSPKLPLDSLKRIIRQKKLPLKIFKSTLPDSPGSFRKMLNKTGFGDVRIWKDSIVCAYQSAEDLYNDIFPASPIPTPSVRDGEGRSADEGNLFMDNTTDEQRIIIKEEFIRQVREYSFPLEISYDFAGGVGVKP